MHSQGPAVRARTATGYLGPETRMTNPIIPWLGGKGARRQEAIYRTWD